MRLRLTRGVVSQGGDVSGQEVPVELHPVPFLRHIQEVAQVPDEDPLEDAGVKIAGPVSITGLHQNSLLCHLPSKQSHNIA